RAVQATLATFERIDALVNNAGSVLHPGPLHETSDEIWDGVIDVFLKGVFRFSRAVIPHMVRRTIEAQYPLGRLGRPDDIAQAVLYLASDDAAWTTGTIVTVDGGITA